MRFPILRGLSLLALVAAQSSTPSPSPSPSLSLSLTTSTATIITSTRSGGQLTQITTLTPTVFNVTYTITPTSTSPTATASASETASPTPEPIVLATILDPAFGVLGALLILTGLPSAFWGHKNRWTSFFLIGFYTLSLICIVLILKFGVLPAVNPPSKTLRGMFVLASAIAGIAGGAISIFFWKAARYCIGGWGGFAFALWLQCFQNGGLIKQVGYRWILYMGSAVIGFILCTIPKIHYHILLISTAFVGSSAFILGVDCFTTAGLKEFYIWNLGFRSLFPKFTTNGIEFPVSETMQIELGLIGAVSLMGVAVQFRILTILQKKLHEIAEEQKKRDEEAELQAADMFTGVMREREEWEKEHPGSRHGRNESGLSSMPLMKDQDGSTSPSSATAERRSPTGTFVNDGRPRYQSGVSDFLAAPTSDEELKRAARNAQKTGALPTLDLGLGIQEDVPSGFIAHERNIKDLSPAELEELKRKEELLAEIQTIRRSIEALKAETPAPSSSATGSRRPSLTSRRTLSIDAGSALLPGPSHLRPPREIDPRARVRSMEMSQLVRSSSLGDSVSRPTSVPLRDEDWDAYVQDRKLLQPPAGVTAPIATTPIHPAPRMQVPQAVTEALNKRKQRENALGFGEFETADLSDDVPLAKVTRHKRSNSSGGNIPITILPPRKPSAVIAAPTPQRPLAIRTRTFEELNERHREKMRDLQAPLTQAEKEHADLEAAKQRWERAKALEKDAVIRRQAEKAALLEKRKRAEDQERTARRSATLNERHSRALSADRLTGLGTSSKRLSTMKVEDWQKYQQDGDVPGSASKRDSHAVKPDAVPFPDAGRLREAGHSRRKSRDPLS